MFHLLEKPNSISSLIPCIVPSLYGMLRGLFHSVALRFLPFPLDGLVPVLCYVCVSLECGGGRNFFLPIKAVKIVV